MLDVLLAIAMAIYASFKSSIERWHESSQYRLPNSGTSISQVGLDAHSFGHLLLGDGTLRCRQPPSEQEYSTVGIR